MLRQLVRLVKTDVNQSPDDWNSNGNTDMWAIYMFRPAFHLQLLTALVFAHCTLVNIFAPSDKSMAPNAFWLKFQSHRTTNWIRIVHSSSGAFVLYVYDAESFKSIHQKMPLSIQHARSVSICAHNCYAYRHRLHCTVHISHVSLIAPNTFSHSGAHIRFYHAVCEFCTSLLEL